MTLQTSAPILAALGLSKSYAGKPALAEASVAVHPGEFVVVLGASGSGKTTLFRCLTRLTEPDGGRVLVDDQPLLELSGDALAAARRKIGVVFQQFNLVRRLSAIDNAVAGRLADAPLWRILLRRFSETDERRAFSALSAVGLAAQIEQRADTLSGGQQQRVAIARAIAQDCRILLADEPVASLDPETGRAIIQLLHDLTRRTGMGVLCTLHQPHLAEAFADRIISMRNGRIVPTPAAAGSAATG